MKSADIIEWVFFNAVGVVGFLSIVEEYIPLWLGIVGGVVLIWYNVERALKIRAERRALEKKIREEK
jgi:hypothetical protein